MELLVAYGVYCAAVYGIGWFLIQGLPLLGALLSIALTKLFEGLGVFFEWLWEWTCELSPHVGRAVVWCAVQLGRRAALYGPLAWDGLREAAVFLYYLLDEVRRDGTQQNKDWQEEDEQEDDEDEFEDEEEDEDVYEKALQLLGLHTGCSSEEFRRAYKLAISRAHPDKGGTHEQALAINTAREIIMSHNGWTR